MVRVSYSKSSTNKTLPLTRFEVPLNKLGIFGTLEAIGWRSRRIVGQVLGESIITGIIGGVAGVGVGAASVWAINRFSPSLTARMRRSFGLGGPGAMPGMGTEIGRAHV